MQPKIINVVHEYTYIKRLELAAKMMEMASPNNAEYVIENVYFDYGQKWLWTTIVRRGFRPCQVLSPRDWERILTAETFTDIAEAVEEIRSDEYFGDK